MPRYKKEKRDDALSGTRQLLLRAAAEEFGREGFVGANINRISQVAGFAKGTVYNHFESKRALMLALIDQIAERHIEFITGRVQEEDNPARRLERFFEAGFAWVSQNLVQARVIITTLNGPDVEFKQHMYQAYQPLFELVGNDILAAGRAQGIFRDVDASATASLVMIIYLGTCSQFDEQGKPWLAPGPVADFVLHALHRENERDVTGKDK
jgi:AcrR family transcriptional regulator